MLADHGLAGMKRNAGESVQELLGIHQGGGEVGVQSSLDIVMIGSPSGCHAEQARTAALAGCHVLVEKPLDISTERIDKLLHKVERTRTQPCESG